MSCIICKTTYLWFACSINMGINCSRCWRWVVQRLSPLRVFVQVARLVILALHIGKHTILACKECGWQTNVIIITATNICNILILLVVGFEHKSIEVYIHIYIYICSITVSNMERDVIISVMDSVSIFLDLFPQKTHIFWDIYHLISFRKLFDVGLGVCRT